MKLLRIILTFFFAAVLSGLSATETTSWFRNSAISPDGSQIVFSYKGNLFLVPSNGGKAHRLTSNKAYDGFAKWSPDGKQIAFSSDRYGNMDIYIVSAQGGTPKRLTTHTQNEFVEAFLDNAHILYRANIQSDAKDLQYPSSFEQIWQVDTAGHRPVLFSPLTMEAISINPQGEMLYQNKKGYEDDWRKHHQSPICRDLYLSQTRPDRTYRKISTGSWEHRNPQWAPDGKDYYFLSEKDGTINLYKSNVPSGNPEQLTHYKNYPVRYLSVAAQNGTLCYSWDGALYTMHKGGEPQKLDIQIVLDDDEVINQPKTVSIGASNFDISKNHKEIAFVLNGDLYTKTVDYKTTKRITHTPEEEDCTSISPDGRTIVFCAERGGARNLYTVSLKNKKDENFTYATDIKEEQLTKGNEPCIMPKFSPDGKKIAYIANKTEIRVLDVKTKKVNVALPAKYNFSYSDGDIGFEWSPDSRWLLTSYMGDGGWNNIDIAAVSADGKKVVDLTNSGYSDVEPQWALGGKAVVWQSDRAGYRSHGSWGAEADAYVMFLDRDLYAKAQLNKEDRALYEARAKADSIDLKSKDKDGKSKEKEAKSAKSKVSKDKKAKDTKEAKTDSVKPLQLDFEGCEDRVKRLTINSSFLNNTYLNPEGTKFYYSARYEGGYDIWMHDLEKNSTKILKKGGGGGEWIPDEKNKCIYLNDRGNLGKLNLATGEVSPISFEAEVEEQTAAEREYLFDHCVQQIENRFCETDFHGVDFKAYAAHYRKFLPEIDNSRDFSEMVSELLGELNCSHTGLKYRSPKSSRPTANLAAFYDTSYKGDGLKILEILKGGSLDLPNKKITPGCIIQQIDHQPIKAGEDYFPLLAGKAGKWILITITDEKGKKQWETYVKPCSLSEYSDLAYKRWVERNAKFTKEYSKGQIGYVHIEDMDSKSFRKIYSEILGKYRNCKALVVDERHNGGGWLHEDLAILLSGKEFMTFTSRGQYLGKDPFSRWNHPSCVLVCEDCYSNAHGFPFMYQQLGLGKLIGMPVAGTMTAVWWESLQDGTFFLGLPEMNNIDINGKACENQTLEPDIKVELSPADQLSGNDTQLRRAIDEMMKNDKSNPIN